MPAVSVVLAVRDGGSVLTATLESVLDQRGADFEVVVVDDGSRDSSRDVAGAFAARDRRVRLLEQPAAGLTAALIRGCSAARAPYIARQDCGDRSLPWRLATLVARLDADPGLVLVSGGVRYLAPRGELLFEIRQTDEEATAGLRATRAEALRGPSIHGCVMFRRATYEAVGGYREAFRVAQDLDLWLRMTECGRVGATPDILYEATFSLDSISAQQRGRQLAAARLALAAALRRRRGESDDAELALAREATRVRPPSRLARARAAYFVGSCLRRREPRSARRYFGDAIAANPLHLKAWLRWLTTAG